MTINEYFKYYVIVAVYREEFDSLRYYSVPALLLDPRRHLVLGADASFCKQADFLALFLCLQLKDVLGKSSWVIGKNNKQDSTI